MILNHLFAAQTKILKIFFINIYILDAFLKTENFLFTFLAPRCKFNCRISFIYLLTTYALKIKFNPNLSKS